MGEQLYGKWLLLNTLGSDKHRHFTPHLTLTMRLSDECSRALFTELQQTEWHTERWMVSISHLQLMQHGEGDPAWRVIGQVGLRPFGSTNKTSLGTCR